MNLRVCQPTPWGKRLFADVPALRAALLEKQPKDFVSHFMFECVPFAFSSDLSSWIGWKTSLAERLQIDPRDVVLTGSGAVGFSLNPNKNFKAFDEQSDIDTGVISPHHFELAWRHLRRLNPAWLSLSPGTKQAIEMHRKKLVFAGTIATDKILSVLPFGPAWQEALDAMAKVAPIAGREVKLRIYKDYDALRSYQADNIERLRGGLASSDAQEVQTIKIEE